MARIRNIARLGTLDHPCCKSPEGRRPEVPRTNDQEPASTTGSSSALRNLDREDRGRELLRKAMGRETEEDLPIGPRL
eukprot:7049562-Heterocapsa_arctica.AAC.1